MAGVLVAAAVICGEAAHAQKPLRVGLGADIPIGGTADLLKSGYHTSVGLAFRVRALRHEIRIDGSITELRTRDSSSTTFRIQSVTADIVMSGPSRLTPTGYVVVGLGTYQQTNAGTRRSDTGANIGAGINFPTHVVGTFIEARLHYIGGQSRTKFFPVTFGIVF